MYLLNTLRQIFIQKENKMCMYKLRIAIDKGLCAGQAKSRAPP